MRKDRHKCGCVSERERERWVSLCDTNKAESDEVRMRWAQERAAAMPKDANVPA